ncbi:sensor domain-containing diguanylate cyclase [Dokdonella sp.]|uniref:sensor domain-containing diguanylate cyclase n=2 Tax=Dokdonella sp. TaxID=2291710 RepID=UPI003BAEF874
MTLAVEPATNPELDFPGRRRFARRVSVMFLLLGLILSTIAVQVYRAVGDFVDAARWVNHSLGVRQEITLTLGSLHSAEASQRAYFISGNVQRLGDYTATAPQIAAHAAKLAELVADDPEQLGAAKELAALLETRIESIQESLALYERGGIEAVRAAIPVGRTRAEDSSIDNIGQRMLRHEDRLQAIRESRITHQALLTRALTVGASILSVLILGVALYLVLREQRHRTASMREARLANRKLLQSLADAQRMGHSLRELANLGEMLQACRDVKEAATGLRISLPRLLPGSSGSVHLINASQTLAQTVAHWGETDDESSDIVSLDDCWALRRGHAYPLSGTTPAFVCRHLLASKAAHPARDHLCVPMIAQGEMLGVISVTSGQEIHGTERSNIIAACEAISMALANLRLQETLRFQSLRDPLTGLFNRRYLEASFEREIQRAERRGIPLSVLMLDIDHFKRFNDSFGHEAGDALLASFGALLGRILRKEDISCRYGGEEFTVVMPEVDTALARIRAEEICAAVRAMDVSYRNLSLGKVTISIGVASYGEHGLTPDELLRNADNALYLAKKGGRDQVVIAEVLRPAPGVSGVDAAARDETGKSP